MIKKITLSLVALSAITFGCSQGSYAEDPMETALAALDATLPGKLINNPYDIQWKTEGSDKQEKIVEASEVPGGYAYSVRVKKKKRNPWDTATRLEMTTSVEKDDVVLVSFWARAAKPQKGHETGDITVALQRNIEPYDSIFEERIALGQDWKLYNVAGKAKRDYAAEKTQLNFNLARAKQTIEFGPYYIMSLGKDADVTQYKNDYSN